MKSFDIDRGTDGVVEITTTLPGADAHVHRASAADVTVTTGNTFNITWNDNGNANADARMTLGLDTDDDHNNGNEVILLRDDPLSNDGNTGTFDSISWTRMETLCRTGRTRFSPGSTITLTTSRRSRRRASSS